MKTIKNRKAVVLILVLFVLLLFSFLTLIATNLISKQTEPFIYHLNSIKALYLAEAGMNYFKEYRLLWDSSFTATNLTINLGTINSVPNNNQRFTIVAPSAARSATVSVTGIADSGSAFEVRRTISTTFTENANKNTSPMLSFRVVNGYFGDPNTPSMDTSMTCGPNPQFYANIYFNSSAVANFTNYCTTIGWNGGLKNLYVERNYSDNWNLLANIVNGNVYAKVSITERCCNYPPGVPPQCPAGCGGANPCNLSCNQITGTSFCPHVSDPNCTDIPADVLLNWPVKPITPPANQPPYTAAPDTTYYDRMLAIAQSMTDSGYNFSGNIFRMNGANFYFKGNVLLTSMGGVGPTFLGPGNIVSNGDIILQGGGTPSIVGARVGLIANTINIQDTAQIGGTTLDANNLITDAGGARLYARGDGTANTFDIDFSSGSATPPRVKGVLMTPSVNSTGILTNNSIRLGRNASNPHAQVQGLVYTRRLGVDIADVFGYIYTDLITSDTGTTGVNLIRGFLRDAIPYAAMAPSTLNALNELPLEIKGLRLTIQSQPTYGP